ncbi:MAG: chromate transporter [Kiritimatiellae bacterium]|nr:chromate transporter [Kiritimatiellia bacterium]
MKKLLSLFFELFKISLFVIGGGYAILAVADDVFSKRGWTEEGEIVEKLPVFQMIPGLIATHTAVYVGNRVAGKAGAVAGVVAVALPSVAIFTFVSAGYASISLDAAWLKSAFLGLRAALTGVIAATIVRSWKRSLHDAFSYSLAAISLAALVLLRANVALVLVAAMAAGLAGNRIGRGKFRCSLLPFLVFFKFGLLCFGGGFVLVPMYIESFVGASAPYLQLPPADFANLMSLTQMTPGPIGVNAATFFGFRLGGVAGAILASAGLLLPGSVLAYFAITSLDRFRTSPFVVGIMRGIRPASIALMLVALWAFATTDGFSPVFVAIAAAVAFSVLKRKMNMMLLVLISALAAMVVRADGITPEDYPDADVVVVDNKIDTEYFADGSFVTIDEEWTKILTEKGRVEASRISLGYNLRYGESKILRVEIIGADGSVREVDFEKTLSDATDNESMDANIYDPMDRRISCSVPGLAVGDIRHTVVRREETKSRVRDQWADIELLEYSFPIAKTTVTVTGPKERPILSKKLRNPLGNVEESAEELEDGRIRHTWTVKDSPQAFPEPNMPPLYTEVQGLLLSTAPDWPAISRWYWETCLPRLEASNEAMTNKVAELEYDMRRIYDFVAQEVRYMGLTMEDTSPGYAPHDVRITFDNRYGVCRDKAALLAAMLRIAGYDAYPTLISASEAKMDPDVPVPFFNHAIVAVEEGGERILMDPTDESSRDMFPAYLCDCSYLVAKPEGDVLRVSPVPPAGGNAVDIVGRGVLRANGVATVEYVIAINGINDNVFRRALLTRKESDRADMFERIFQKRFPGAELLDFGLRPANLLDTTEPLVVSATVRLPGCIVNGDWNAEIETPCFSDEFGVVDWLLAGNTSLLKRKYPLKLVTTAATREHLELDISACPFTQSPVKLPEGYSLDESGGKLVFARERAIGKVEYSPGEYLELREAVAKRERSDRERPVFARDLSANDDTVTWSRCLDISFKGEREWTVTNSFRSSICTYDGKKKSSELAYRFNPSWKNVEIVSATVKTALGETIPVGEREINTMDADWVAFAPRYPASKVTVVSLPAVERGSEIEVVSATSASNAPAGFYGKMFFDSFETALGLSLRVNGRTARTNGVARLLPVEKFQPDGELWRDVEIVASNRFEKIDFGVRPVDFAEKDVRSIRDWMAKNVRVAGPSLYELPLELQLTDPETVIAERYASRLDYVRTMCSMLKGAGFDADIVLAADNADDWREKRRRDMVEFPNVAAFCLPLCRVGNVFIGTENEYTPLGASQLDGADFYDPATGGFGVVSASSPDLRPACVQSVSMTVNADLSVDVEWSKSFGGATAGEMRKRYAEMLPEERSRNFQKLLGELSQSAVATSGFETDLESYPFAMSYSAHVPGYARSTDDDVVSVDLPCFTDDFRSFPPVAAVRETPIAIDAGAEVSAVYRVTFPQEYSKLEYLPRSFRFDSPCPPFDPLVEMTSRVVSQSPSLTVEIRFDGFRHPKLMLDGSYAGLVRSWAAAEFSKAVRMVSARKPADGNSSADD